MTTSSARKIILMLAGLSAAAAGSAPVLRAEDATRPEDTQRFIYTLTVTDKLRVEVFQEGELTTIGRVDASGNVNLPLIGDIHLAGLTVDQAQAAVEKAYIAKRYLRHPQVTISIDEYAPREVTIMGQVKNPSRYLLPLESTWSVVDLVSKAGGFTDTAKGSDVSITRYAPDGTKTVTKVDVDSIIKGKKSAKTTDSSQLLQPGDIVFVPESII